MALPARNLARLAHRCGRWTPTPSRWTIPARHLATQATTREEATATAAGAPPSDNYVKIVEVGPRDGLQNEKKPIQTWAKIELIDRLAKAGLRTIEAGSFVSPKWVPQMKDSDEILETLLQQPIDVPHPLTFSFLVPNARGLDDMTALLQKHSAASSSSSASSSSPPPPAIELAVFAAATESFSQANLNCSMDASLERFRRVIEQAKATATATATATASKTPLRVRAYISVVLGCPFEGPNVDPHAVARMATALLAMGADEIALGDTTGMGTAPRTRALLRTLAAAGVRTEDLALHLHDTYGQALVNTAVGLEHGIRTFDSAVAGLGGCPYSPGATGNVATEDLVYYLHSVGMDTGGVDLDRLVDVGAFITSAEHGVGRPSASSVARAILGARERRQGTLGGKS